MGGEEESKTNKSRKEQRRKSATSKVKYLLEMLEGAKLIGAGAATLL